MNYGSQAGAVAPPKEEIPIALQLVGQLDDNLSRLWNSIDMIENRCHKILNLRTPMAEEKSTAPLENDFIQSVGNRLTAFSRANDKLNDIVNHLDKIV